jgi:hypothetical protein
MDRIEDFAGTKIEVRPNPNPISSLNPKPNAAELAISHEAAWILVRDTVTGGDILHELLHVERYWMEQVPLLLPTDDHQENSEILNDLNNTTEHLTIIPRQKALYGFDSSTYWNEVFHHNWSLYPWAEMTDPEPRRRNCLLLWLATEALTNDPEVETLARAALREEKLLYEAEQFRQRVHQLLHNKVRVLAACARFLRLPRNGLQLVYLDIRSRNRRVESVPAH